MLVKIIIITVAVIALGIIAVLNQKSNLYKEIGERIAFAENQKLTGEEKMRLVVDCVYAAVIPILKAYFNKNRIEKIAQAVYNSMVEFYKNKKRAESEYTRAESGYTSNFNSANDTEPPKENNESQCDKVKFNPDPFAGL